MISPMSNRILVDLKEEEEVTTSGIILTSKGNTSACYYGVIASVGPGARLIDGSFEALIVKAGDRIAFDKRPDYQTITVDAKKYVICRESDVVGVFDS